MDGEKLRGNEVEINGLWEGGIDEGKGIFSR